MYLFKILNNISLINIKYQYFYNFLPILAIFLTVGFPLK